MVALLKAGADPACVDDSDKTGWERALGAQRSTVLARLEGLATKVRKISSWLRSWANFSLF